MDRSLEKGQSSGIGQRFLRGRDFIQLSELLIEVENELLSCAFPRYVQDSAGDIGVYSTLFSLALGGGGHMGGIFLRDPLGIHIIKVFPHNGLAHVTKSAFVENTIHKIIFQPE